MVFLLDYLLEVGLLKIIWIVEIKKVVRIVLVFLTYSEVVTLKTLVGNTSNQQICEGVNFHRTISSLHFCTIVVETQLKWFFLWMKIGSRREFRFGEGSSVKDFSINHTEDSDIIFALFQT